MYSHEIEEIESLTVDGAGQSFSGNDFRSLRAPGVYALMLEGACLYVGMGMNVIGRISGEGHQQSWKAIKQWRLTLIRVKGTFQAWHD